MDTGIPADLQSCSRRVKAVVVTRHAILVSLPQTKHPVNFQYSCHIEMGQTSYGFCTRGFVMSLARPGKKQATGRDPENRVGDQENGSLGMSVSSGLQVPGEPGHCRARTRPTLVIFPRRFSF